MSRWDLWPCAHAVTLFYRIEARHLWSHVPAPLAAWHDDQGYGEIELGYNWFFAGPYGLPASEELAWGIRVNRVKGLMGKAFLAMNITANNEQYLARAHDPDGFHVHRPPARFDADLSARVFAVRDAAGDEICTLRYHRQGAIPMPLLPGTTEVFNERVPGRLERREFKWRGLAQLRLSPTVGSVLRDHPFFRGVPVSKADPLPIEVLASVKGDAIAAQRFTRPVAWP